MDSHKGITTGHQFNTGQKGKSMNLGSAKKKKKEKEKESQTPCTGRRKNLVFMCGYGLHSYKVLTVGAGFL
jgi:hypothetical protein